MFPPHQIRLGSFIILCVLSPLLVVAAITATPAWLPHSPVRRHPMNQKWSNRHQSLPATTMVITSACALLAPCSCCLSPSQSGDPVPPRRRRAPSRPPGPSETRSPLSAVWTRQSATRRSAAATKHGSSSCLPGASAPMQVMCCGRRRFVVGYVVNSASRAGVVVKIKSQVLRS